MDAAYDHIQEEVLRPDENTVKEGEKPEEASLNAEFQEAYKSFTASPWGAKLGGFFGTVKKQGESYYQGARQEASAVGEEALKGFTDLRSTLVSRARSLSTNEAPPPGAAKSATDAEVVGEDESKQQTNKERTESEALRESEGIVSRFRVEAAKRLKEIEKAEDAADEALLKFGTNIRNFLRDAVSIAPPTEEVDKDGQSKVLFESKDQDGKRVIHTTRLDAQLHAIHSSLDNFTKDPISPEYEKWKTDFNVEKKTEGIATDLDKYEELRRAMEKLVPEKVEYEQFWKRYYFLRMVVESEDQRRKELLKGAALSPTEEIGWDEDSESEPEPSTTPQPRASPVPPKTPTSTNTQPTNSTTAEPLPPISTESGLKPASPRRSQDQHSQPDSDASYDLVSGATSRAPGSPKEEKEQEKERGKKGIAGVAEESDEEDWE